MAHKTRYPRNNRRNKPRHSSRTTTTESQYRLHNILLVLGCFLSTISRVIRNSTFAILFWTTKLIFAIIFCIGRFILAALARVISVCFYTLSSLAKRIAPVLFSILKLVVSIAAVVLLVYLVCCAVYRLLVSVRVRLSEIESKGMRERSEERRRRREEESERQRKKEKAGQHREEEEAEQQRRRTEARLGQSRLHLDHAFMLWRQQCKLLLIRPNTLTALPKPPLRRCNKQNCVSIHQHLGVSTHVLEDYYTTAALRKEELRNERNFWHTNGRRWNEVPEEYRQDVQAVADEVTKVVSTLLDARESEKE